jgi:hypothetical protein
MYSRLASSSLENANVCIWGKRWEMTVYSRLPWSSLKNAMFVALKNIGDDRL